MALSRYEEVRAEIAARPRAWLVTGVAGFIGSNLLETLLRLGQTVTGLDNLATGHRHNLDEVRELVGAEAWARFRFIEGDITRPDDCREACRGVELVLHQAALGSVPRSIENPAATHAANLDGFLNMLIASRDAGVKGFVYASSSSVYGDHPALPKVEDAIGRPLSPYALTKLANEQYAEVFARCYGFRTAGLRYFNVFGPRQDPEGPYAAVIPRWIISALRGEPVQINGDGETSRDFCHVDNAVQANLLAALAPAGAWEGHMPFNVAVGERTSLNELFAALFGLLGRERPALADLGPSYRDFRAGDVRHSLADTSRAARLLGYVPTRRVREGLEAALPWYLERLG